MLISRVFLHNPARRFSRLHAAFCNKPPEHTENSQKEVTDENAQMLIHKWVTENRVVLFMKGTPLAPCCGYSNFVVELLKKYGMTDYKAINILDDPVIREQVKIYSKWPTYPQLYIDSQLIGGSNILHEMHLDESLNKLLSDKGLL